MARSSYQRWAIFTSVAVATAVLGAGAPAATDEDGDPVAAEIEGVLATQVACWNRGDLDGFMETYWRSPDLTFSSGGETRRGWDDTQKRYQARYPTPERMGRTTFSELEVRPLGASAALVLGRWELERAPDPIGGNFSLVMQKLDGQWRIVHDHTSVKP